MDTMHLPEILRARREDIAEQAECEGCGTTLEECRRLAAANTDPTAPPWFGCCAMGTAMGPCNHRPNAKLLSALLKEIENGAVRTVDEVRAKRAEKAARAKALRAEATPPGMSSPLGYADRFDQGEWWLTKDSGWIRITDMEPSHRVNTARFLLRRAATVADKVSWALAVSFGGAPDDVMDDLISEQSDRRRDPQAWLRSTALYRALVDGMQVDARTDDLMAGQNLGHPFTGMGRTCGFPVSAGAGDEFIRCGRGPEEHA